MNGKQQVVAAAGVGLVLVNFWTGDARASITGGVFGKGNAADTARAHHELATFAGELVFVAVAAMLAGLSDSWGTAMVAVIFGLFLLWTMHHYGKTSTGNAATTGVRTG